YRSPSSRRALFDHAGTAVAGPAFGQAPPSQSREGTVGTSARRGTGGARRRRRAGSGTRLEGGRRRSGRGVFSVLVSQSGARAARQGNSRARAAGRFHRHFVVDIAAISRIRAFHHGLLVR